MACPATGRAPRPIDWQSGSVSDLRKTLRRAHRAFNAREIDIATELMHPEVDWPNAWEGGRVVGRAAVRDYWDRQFEVISGELEPQEFTEVRHRYRFENGLIARMDVVEP